MQIIEPTLLLDEQKAKANIQRMYEKAQRNNITFRPHFKTHQSIDVGRWFRAVGLTKITVSSLRMAQYFAKDGWEDITVAFPVNILEIDRINALAKTIKLNLLVESTATANALQTKLASSVHVFIKIDAGYGRTGIRYDDVNAIQACIDRIELAEKLHFKGFLAHSGHSYGARGQKDLAAIHRESQQRLSTLKAKFAAKYPKLA